MIKNLGISVYPTKMELQDTLNYIDAAHQNGFTRLFVAFLGVEESREAMTKSFSEVIKFAKERNFEVSCDVHPGHIEAVQKDKNSPFVSDLSFFNELGIDIIRLDVGYSEIEEAFMSKNPHGIKIEMNMSMKSDHVEGVITFGGDKDNLLGCHNYYPHAYTGLTLDFFHECNDVWRRNNLRTAAFVCSQSDAKLGPWPVSDGLPTLEMHRNLPIVTQVMHYVSMDCIDDILIGDVASIEELEAIGKMNQERFSFKVDFIDGLSSLAQEVLSMNFSRRFDTNEFMIRTIESRMMFMKSQAEIKPLNTVDIKRGDIIMDNELYGQYSGEVQIALKDMKNSGRTNVVGRIDENEIFLIDYIKPGQAFIFEVK